jgi:hypothetical protein
MQRIAAGIHKLIVIVVLGLLVAGCGGDTASTSDGSTEAPTGDGADVLDPCMLAGDAVLTAYFGAPFDGEPSEAGPIDSCTWRDTNANSLLIQVAVDFPLQRPDSCPDCVELAFADDGYAAPSPFQTTAKFVVGNSWYSVTTTGFGDDAESISSLAETVLANANG